MSNDNPDRQRRIADLEATLRLPVPASIRRQLEAERHALISFGASSQIGDVSRAWVGNLRRAARLEAVIQTSLLGVSNGNA